MVRSISCFIATVANALFCGGIGYAQEQVFRREPTDVMIRRMAGLPPGRTRGEIKIIDVGHHPSDTMISIIANRTPHGWEVSYACAMSPYCGTGTDHAARQYVLSAIKTAEVDHIVDALRAGMEPDGTPPTPDILGGNLLVSVNYKGFSHEYRRVIWGTTLGRLETLLGANEH